MIFFALAASAATLAAAQPAHSVDIDHRGSRYRVDYRPQVEMQMRTVGMSAGPRPSTQRCVVQARILVQRVIAGAPGQELTSLLRGSETVTEHLPGACAQRDEATARLLANKASLIGTHLALTAEADRAAALAAIDTAHHFAAN